MSKFPSLLLPILLTFTVFLFPDHARAASATVSAKPSDGVMEIKLPDRWSIGKTEEKHPFWWVNFTDSYRDANVFVSMERKIGFGYRYPLLENWGKNFIERMLKRYAGEYAYDIREITKKIAMLGSGQEAEFSVYRLIINGNHRSVAFAVLSSKDDARRALVEIFPTGTFGNVSESIETVAKGIFFND